MPIEPKGTRPISTLWPERRSQRSEPIAMPTEKTASSSVTTLSFPPSTSLLKPANEVRNTDPKNHSQEIPSTERNTLRFCLATIRLRQVSETGFQLILSAGSAGGDRGMNPAAMRPSTATTSDTAATYAGPFPGIAISSPPIIVPRSIATKVPISTMPFPPVSSWSSRCCGR